MVWKNCEFHFNSYFWTAITGYCSNCQKKNCYFCMVNFFISYDQPLEKLPDFLVSTNSGHLKDFFIDTLVSKVALPRLKNR